ncbi:MAG: hypothetical protein HY724_05845 [Candidatus Rokubacteria bacterium]|nr:hypothetical protein [Candidatus Rokubacteria bacterium]
MLPRAFCVAGAFILALLAWPGPGEPHLFHFANVRSQETQVARDFRLIKELTQWGRKDFDLAGKVYRGELRLRERKPSEPGYLLKADYQVTVRVPPLKALVRSTGDRLGTSLDAVIEAALDRRDADRVETAFRKIFYVQIQELLAALERRLVDAQAAEMIFGVLADYLFTSYEVFLALNHPRVHGQVKDALEHLREALPRAGAAKSASPGEFGRWRHRLERLLASVTPMR